MRGHRGWYGGRINPMEEAVDRELTRREGRVRLMPRRATISTNLRDSTDVASADRSYATRELERPADGLTDSASRRRLAARATCEPTANREGRLQDAISAEDAERE